MRDTSPHLQALEELEKAGIAGLLEVLREEGIDGVRYALWDATGWHRDYSRPHGGAESPPIRSAKVGRWR